MKSQDADIIGTLCRKMVEDLHDTLVTLYDQLPSCPFNLSVERDMDLRTFDRRFAAEGLGFLTHQLPQLGKALDQNLADIPTAFTGFAPFEHRWPVWLRSAWYVIRTYQENALRAEDVGHLLRILRTIAFGFYKLEVPPTPDQISMKLHEFLITEQEVSSFEMPADNRVTEYARHCLKAALEDFDYSNLRPKHGPGAVATGEKDEEKWVFSHLYESLHARFPYYDFMYGIRSNGRALQLAANASRYRSMTRMAYPVAKLVFVPKDSRGPRIISSEPLELQYMQQAVARPLMAHIETSRYTRGHVNFTDQTINGNLALVNSRSGRLATLDLSEASDRVSLLLFRSLWPEEMIEDFEALRSHATLLPNGQELYLKKFAPMGSALCFPVESLIFWSLCVAALMNDGVPFDEARADVYVYGDDIVVPVNRYASVCAALSDHGLKVNDSKSFRTGKFRESCGVDAWNNQVVTPQRIRKMPGNSPSDGPAYAAWCAYSSQFLAMGMHHCADYARAVVERDLGRIPTTSISLGYLSIVDPNHTPKLSEYKDVTWSPDSCYPRSKLWRLKTSKRPTTLDSWERLHMNLLGEWGERDPSEVVARSTTKMSKTKVNLIEFSFWDWVTA